MTIEEKFSGAAKLLLLGFGGLLALIAMELLRAIEAGGGEVGMPGVDMLVGMLCVAATPIILCALGRSGWVRWTSLVIAALLALFHAMHILEHIGAGDMPLTLLIAVTMFVPNAFAAWLLWRAK